MANRLSGATSPYLLQHADNPVDWWPWSDEALAEARRRDVPVLLSVGYAACHWCHVMAHESFEDAETAALINEHFVAVKVDREERPDIDAVYMQAVQAMTGQGGWPMTAFLTPDGAPFYCGTYFPPVPAHGMPAFRQVLGAVAEAWEQRRDEVSEGARQIVADLARLAGGPLGPSSGDDRLDDADVEQAVTLLHGDFDTDHPGFGRAPKFPPSLVIEALLREGGEPAVTMATRTLRAMADGGIHDQLGGGFARYSVDAAWTVPHFEKMLYDNALLLGCYTHAWRRDPDGPDAAQFAEVAAGIVGFLLRELRTPEGGFAASLDADSPGPDGRPVEGAFYVWTPAQLAAVLGDELGARAAAELGVSDVGSFERGTSTLTRRDARTLTDDGRWPVVRERLWAAREERARPARDDKVVAAWNGWTVSALVEAAGVFERPDWLDAARTAAELVWRLHWDAGAAGGAGRLRRTSRDGVAGSAAGLLEDYAALTEACVRLAEVLGPDPWLGRAEALAAVVLTAFGTGPDGAEGAADGGFYDTAADAETLVTRPRDPTDNATPSGTSAAVLALQRLSDLTGELRWQRRAERALDSAAVLVRRAPRFAGWLLAATVTRLRQSAVQVAIAGDPDDPATAALATLARRAAPAGSVVVVGRPDQSGVALLADRPLRDGRPTAYVCRHFVCRLPVTEPAELAEQLAAL
ncbi:hypothetical protein FHX74_002162 [Friedmanniella endophytica]|uniref:Spermatogenesis-associated protein 20-like TRX domain-containing protein n=1 Tax=Microlunatus kandeliicorticis TaxID=1759536 RepID=A0A7W3ISP2_9ACTN|nr:thioredoxin domain-containing protein [Microlunatus kandeliicorticis]MBA8794543.1 hypothetical protein [Microlunatus kandeliicorticis]